MSEFQHSERRRVVALVDGFNLYHSIDDFVGLDCLKWLNIRSLLEAFVLRTEELSAVYFFTALPPWSLDKRLRQQTLLDVYRDNGVVIVPGEFKQARATCLGACRQIYDVYEEKQTDMNIALRLARIAHHKTAEVAILLTGDSDQVPAINYARELNPDLQIRILLPPFRRAKELISVSHDHAKINQNHFARHRLPDTFALKTGVMVKCPGKWLTTSSTSSAFGSLEPGP